MKKPTPNPRSLVVHWGVRAIYDRLDARRAVDHARTCRVDIAVQCCMRDVLASGSAALRFGHEAVLAFLGWSGCFICLRIAQAADPQEFA